MQYKSCSSGSHGGTLSTGYVVPLFCKATSSCFQAIGSTPKASTWAWRSQRCQSSCQATDCGYQSKVDGRLTAFDPRATFKIGAVNGREAQESGLRRDASVGPGARPEVASASVRGSNPTPATMKTPSSQGLGGVFRCRPRCKGAQGEPLTCRKSVVEGIYFSHSLGGLLAFSATPESAVFS